MKKLFLPLILSGFVAANANAITVENDDFVYFGPGGVTQYDGSFNLNSAGYDYKTQQITSATATFTFLDILGSERLKISLDGSYFVSSSSIFGLVNLGGKVVVRRYWNSATRVSWNTESKRLRAIGLISCSRILSLRPWQPLVSPTVALH
jgi:hypothetical protein